MADMALEIVAYADLPQWFGLSFLSAADTTMPTLVFSLDILCVIEVQPILAAHRSISMLKSGYGLKSYEPDLTKGFGFDEVSLPGVKKAGKLEILIPFAEDPLTVHSEMPEGGYIFSDGVLEKALPWNAGSTVVVSVGDRYVQRVIG